MAQIDSGGAVRGVMGWGSSTVHADAFLTLGRAVGVVVSVVATATVAATAMQEAKHDPL